MPRRDRLPSERLVLHPRDDGASSSLGLMSLFACSDLLYACSNADDVPGVTYEEYMKTAPDATGYPPDRPGAAAARPEDDETELAALQAQVRTLKQQLSAKDSQLDHARRSPRPVELRDGFDRDKARELAYVHVGCEFTLPPREGEISPCAARTAFVDTGDDWADDDLATPRTDEGLLDGRKIYADA